MTNIALEVGAIYSVNHTRKGMFSAKVLSDDGIFVKLEIVSGVAGAHMAYNIGLIGDVIDVRKSFCQFVKEL